MWKKPAKDGFTTTGICHFLFSFLFFLPWKKSLQIRSFQILLYAREPSVDTRGKSYTNTLQLGNCPENNINFASNEESILLASCDEKS